VQGSALGPARFSLYCKDLPAQLGKAFTKSCADDTYVILSATNLPDLLELTKITMDKHFNYLDQLRMVVNKGKTEVMLMKHHSHTNKPSHLNLLSGETIELTCSLKVLGIQFDHDMSWKTHMENIIMKSNRMISGLKTIRHVLTEEQFLTVSTAQYFGSLYYGLPTWYHPLKVKFKKHIEILHYKLLRLVVKDWYRLCPKDMLDTLDRATLDKFADYAIANVVIKSLNKGIPTRLHDEIIAKMYSLRRSRKLRSFDSARKRIRKQAIGNRTDNIIKIFDKSWTTLHSKDDVRKYLKRFIF